jgi:uroporphyrinogen decarboxylase
LLAMGDGVGYTSCQYQRGEYFIMKSPFTTSVVPDWEEFVATIRRLRTPRRVHNIELFLDGEVKDALCTSYHLDEKLDRADPFFYEKREIAVQRFLGYDYVVCNLEGLGMSFNRHTTDDTAGLKRQAGREFMDEHRGPITSWDEFEKYHWPDTDKVTSRSLDWYQKNLPDDMCIIGGLVAHFAENLSWLMGYETLCIALYEQPDLVQAISDRSLEIDRIVLSRILTYDRVRLIWGSDDMGFRSGPLISPKHMRAFVLPGHKAMAAMSHNSGRPYLLHSCGNLSSILSDLIEDVQIDAKHSFEDTIEDICEDKKSYGDRLTLLGGIDLDFLCRTKPSDVRQRVRYTLDVCQPGGGYCLGTGNSVANYIPVDNYLAMLDEGRKYT